MKEVLIVVFILLIIIFTSVYICNYLNKTSKTLMEDLERIKQDMNKEEITNKELLKKAEDTKKKWDRIKEVWSNIVLHQEIDSIETALIKLKVKIETGKNEEALEDLETAIFLLRHINEKEKTSLKNIF